jgi:hypothetical protein
MVCLKGPPSAPGVGHIELLLVGREAKAVRHAEVADHDIHLPALWIEPVDIARQLRLLAISLVVTADAIIRVGEPHAVIGLDDHPVR